METKCVLRRRDGVHDGQLVGPFDVPADAVSFAMATLGLDSSQFLLEVVNPPVWDHPRPLLRVLSNDAA